MESLMERIVRQEKLAAIGKMSGSIAHELRNPLGAMKQAVYFLKSLQSKNRLITSGPKVKEHLELLDEEIMTSDRVITNLLQMTRMKPLEQEQMNLRNVILDAANRCQIDDRIQLEIDLEPEKFLLWADQLHMRQVLMNLLTNASQAISQNGES